MRKKISFVPLLITLLSIALLVIAVKGKKGNPIAYQNTTDTSVGTPFESSNSSSRYALTQAIVDNQRFTLTDRQAQLSSPDLVRYHNTYFSIFTPGISFISVPFYYLGKSLGFPQLFTYFSTLLFALLNLFLVYKISLGFGAKRITAALSGFLFLFATNAYVYALTLTQHHASVTIVLFGLLNAQGKRTFIKDLIFGLIFSAGLLIDIPNAFFLLPIGLSIFFDHFSFQNTLKNIRISFNTIFLLIAIGALPLLLAFGYYNHSLTGSYTKIGQFIGQYNYPDANPAAHKKVDEPKPVISNELKSGISLPFNTRLQLQGFTILLLSEQRGWLFYSPIVFLGVLGMIISIKKDETQKIAVIATAVVLINILMYSMFGDPWGGWSFGPRYLIPAAAIMIGFIAPAMDKYRKNIFFVIVLFALVGYSMYVTFMGAFTTSAIPPKGEAEHLLIPIPFTYHYNLDLLEKNFSSSLVYNLFLSQKVSSQIFVEGLTIFSVGFFFLLYGATLDLKRKKKA